MNVTEDQRQEYEEQLEELDEKTLLIQQLTELAAIRQQLQVLNSQTINQSTESEHTVTCNACQTEVKESDKASHAVTEHNAPPDMPVGDLGLY